MLPQHLAALLNVTQAPKAGKAAICISVWQREKARQLVFTEDGKCGELGSQGMM